MGLPLHRTSLFSPSQFEIVKQQRLWLELL
jgi:hypothetical protein